MALSKDVARKTSHFELPSRRQLQCFPHGCGYRRCGFVEFEFGDRCRTSGSGVDRKCHGRLLQSERTDSGVSKSAATPKDPRVHSALDAEGSCLDAVIQSNFLRSNASLMRFESRGKPARPPRSISSTFTCQWITPSITHLSPSRNRASRQSTSDLSTCSDPRERTTHILPRQ